MTREEAIDLLQKYKEESEEDYYVRRAEALDMAIKALEQESCGDCISREAVMHILDEVGGDFDSPREAVVPIDYIADMVSELPSVTPQQKMGRWIYDYTTADEHRTYHCSNCGCYLKPKHSEPLNSFKWCSLCGAKMQEVEG